MSRICRKFFIFYTKTALSYRTCSTERHTSHFNRSLPESSSGPRFPTRTVFVSTQCGNPPFLCTFDWSWGMNSPLGRRFIFRPLSNHFDEKPPKGGRLWPPSFFLLVFASQKQAKTSPVRRLSTKKRDFYVFEVEKRGVFNGDSGVAHMGKSN